MKSVTYIAAISMMGWCDSLDGCAPVYSEGTDGTVSSTSSTGESGATAVPTGTAPTGGTDPTGEVSTASTGAMSTGSTSAASASTGTSSTSSVSEASTTTGDTTTMSTSEASTASTGEMLPAAPVLTLAFSQTIIKTFDFSWPAAAGAQTYQLWESPNGDGIYDEPPLVEGLIGTKFSLTRPLHLRFGASYVLKACNAQGCTDSEEVKVAESMAETVGYFKASAPGIGDLFGYSVAISADGYTIAVGAPHPDGAGAVYMFVRSDDQWKFLAMVKAPAAKSEFGHSVALSADGTTLAVGAPREDGGNVMDSGAVYMFVRSNDTWPMEDYIKAFNKGSPDLFGHSVALSADGTTLAVGAIWEDGPGPGVNPLKSDDSGPGASGAGYVYVWKNLEGWVQQAYIKASNPGASDQFGRSATMSADGNTLAFGAHQEDGLAGAAYVFARAGDVWSEQAYLKASNIGVEDRFGVKLAMSADGNTLAVGAHLEDSAATGVNGLQGDNIPYKDSGAAYVFVRAGADWSKPPTYIKASNTGKDDYFGIDLALSGDGKTLAVGAYWEDSVATGVGGEEGSNGAVQSGAVYVFSLAGDTWSQRGYVKASNTETDDNFGWGIALSEKGDTLAVGAQGEDSAAIGVGGDQSSNVKGNAGAVYVY